MNRPSSLAAVLSLAAFVAAAPICAQETIGQNGDEAITQAATAPSGGEIRLDWIGTVRPDCSIGEPPAIDYAEPTSHGVVRITSGTVTTTRVRNCPEVTVPARVIFYRSTAGYTGADSFALRVGTGEDASTKVYNITVE